MKRKLTHDEVEHVTRILAKRLTKKLTRNDVIAGLTHSLFRDASYKSLEASGNRRVPSKPTLDELDSRGGRVVLNHTTGLLALGWD